MTPLARALALVTAAALAIVGLAAPAQAASPAIVSTSPTAGGATGDTPGSVSIQWDQSIASGSSISVSGPAGASACTKTVLFVPPNVLTCSFGLFPSVPDGTYTVTYSAGSTSGDPATTGSFTFVVDTVAPPAPTGLTIAPGPYTASSTTLTVSGSTESTTDEVAVTLSSSGGGTPVLRTVAPTAGTGFSASYTAAEVAGLGDGTLTASVRSTDRADNTGPATTTSTVKDVVAPPRPTVSTVTDPVNNASKTAVSVTGNAGQAGLVVRVTVGAVTKDTTSTSGGAFTATGIDVTSLPDGPLSVTATSRDAVLNPSPASDAVTTVKDTASPVRTASSPADGATVASPASVSLTFSEALATGSITVPGVPGSSTRSGSTVTFTPSAPLPDGTYTATAAVTDLRGNPGSGTTTFTVGTPVTPVTPPGLASSTTTMTALAPLVTVLDTIIVAGTVARGDESGPRGAVRVTVVDDDRRSRVVGTVTPAADGTWRLLHKPTANGTYTATYVGDARNATSSSAPQRTQVKVLVRASAKTGPASQKAKVRGTVSPVKAGTKVSLFRLGRGKAVLLGLAKVRTDGSFAFSVRLPRGRTPLEVRIKATPGNLGNSVRLEAVRT